MPSGTPTPVVVALLEAVGASVTTDAASLQAAQADKSGHRSATAPLAVVTARSIAEVQQTLRIASAHGTPVVTRGAGTGLAGGAIGSAGEIVLSTLAMDRLLEVNAADELAVIEPGIINAALNDQLAPHGLWFTPDPASRATSTVGGNIATNAGGLLCAKYGVTRDSVLGLKVVLADGRLLELGHRSVKGVTGLDLTALMVGSEGTLGVIVEATVRLRRLVPGVTPTIGAYFADVRTAAAASAAVTAAGIRPAVMELMDAASLDAIGALLGLPLRSLGDAYLLVQTDGAGAEAEATELLALLQAAGGTAELTTDAGEAARLLEVRRAMHPAMESLGTTLIEDVAVPRSALPAMFEAIAAIEQKYGIVIPTIAHAGDGNLHPNFVFEGPDVPDHIWQAADEMFQAAVALGGTLTGEHGIGLLKRRWLRGELGDEQFELQQQIKRVFDPAGILNPGKVF
ncbi:FAD-binding oxidoreductase [Microterricola viridarii]|uniref:FAD-linked oxidase n=1 Tax=Microterricola viridarii TaxID=412690 RepID=A0A0X8E4N3_9MICO|nr:FAD-linked oxidase C-terminal domain-containing protein [Microterricola viridarii]AMB59654.1 FAD-linked oxidase [Microterricola viridarii]